MEYNDIEQMEIEHMDIMLRSVNYHFYKMLEIGDRLEEISFKLSGSVSSPIIRSKEESLYQSGTKVYRNNIAELMIKEEELASEMAVHSKELQKIGSLLDGLDFEELELLHNRYENQFTLATICIIQYGDCITKQAIQKKLQKILFKLSKK